jgi:hypothetical protein
MTRDKLIQKTIQHLSQLPNQKIQEVSDYAETLLRGIDQKILAEGMQQLVSEAKAFDFLAEDDDLYSAADVIEKYGDQR